MAWVEDTGKRRQRSKTWVDSVDPRKRVLAAKLAALHYRSDPDSDVYDSEVDLTPVRVNNAQFDGWRVTQNGYHYALGKDLANHGDQDGWVGFGGRRGAHWFKFRLVRAGYLHWPTRAEDIISGTPDYTRANLSSTVGSDTLGPEGAEATLNLQSVATWESIFTTPGGGRMDVRWRVDGDHLKEEVVVNQAARDWIRTNRPPATPADETYFGFVFQVDWSDIPKVLRGAVQVGVNDDFDDGEEDQERYVIELRDAADRLLAFMPVGDAIVEYQDGDGRTVQERLALRKRFWEDGGNHYLLVGQRVDRINSMRDGDIVFDPTIDDQVGASGDDGYVWSSSFYDTDTSIWAGHDSGGTKNNAWARFTGISGLSGATINTSYYSVYGESGNSNTRTTIYAEDAAAPAAPTSVANYDSKTVTSASVDWDGAVTVSAWNNSPSINSIIQELADDYDPSAIQILHKGRGTWYWGNNYDPYDESSSNAPKLHIEYTSGAAGIVSQRLLIGTGI